MGGRRAQAWLCARAMMDILGNRPPGEGVDALCEFLSNLIENGGGESGRPRY